MPTATAKPTGLIGLKCCGAKSNANSIGPMQLPAIPMTRLPKNPEGLPVGKNIVATNPTTAPNPTQTSIKLTHAWVATDSSIALC